MYVDKVYLPIFNQIVNVVDFHFQGQILESSTFGRLYVIMLQIVTGQMLLFPTHRKSRATSRLAYSHLTLVNSKGHGQGHVHFIVDISPMATYRVDIVIFDK